MDEKFLGKQWIVELHGCPFSKLNDKNFLREQMLQAARISRATIVCEVFHSFNPHGLSGVVVIAESHFAIHTWPEYGCASIDIFSCGELDVEAAIEFLKEVLRCMHAEVKVFQRGRLSGPLFVTTAPEISA